MPGLAYGGGDIFVGGSLPFGVAKVGIDTYETNVSFSTLNGGWTPKGLVTGLSMMVSLHSECTAPVLQSLSSIA